MGGEIPVGVEAIKVITLTPKMALEIAGIGLLGGTLSGFLGSGGAFIMTPAMMSLGIPGIMAVAANITHKFGKAIQGAKKHSEFGNVDKKMGLVLVVDVNGYIVIANCSAQTLLELPGEYKEKMYTEILPPNSPFATLLAETLHEGTQYTDLNVSWVSSRGDLDLIVSTNNKPSPKALAIMHREITRLDTIVNQLLYFSKPGEAKFSYHDINLVINDVLGFFIEIHYGKFNVIKTFDYSLSLAWIDREQIERVLSNIFFNSIQAMPQGGTIQIKTLGSNSFIRIDISDTGCGIAQEHLVHLFDPFYSARPKGIGLGLAIAHEIIQAHGGHIELESEVGKGTIVSLYLKVGEEDKACLPKQH